MQRAAELMDKNDRTAAVASQHVVQADAVGIDKALRG
jgi:hypothetical protein